VAAAVVPVPASSPGAAAASPTVPVSTPTPGSTATPSSTATVAAALALDAGPTNFTAVNLRVARGRGRTANELW
jgi:hypothetical protein